MKNTRSSYDTTNAFYLWQKISKFLKYARAYLRKGRHASGTSVKFVSFYSLPAPTCNYFWVCHGVVRSQGHYWSNAHLRDHRSGCLLKRFLEAKDLIMLAAVVAEGWREWSRIWTEASVSRSPDKGYAISGNEIETSQTVKHSSARIATK